MVICRVVLVAGFAASLNACGIAEKLGANSAHNYATYLHSGEAHGVGLGAEAPFRESRFSIGVEAAAFRNAEDKTSGYALTHVEMDLIENRPRNPRVGAFLGFVSDPAHAARFENRYPVFGNFHPFVGFQLTVPTVGPHELRMRVSPGYSSETAVFSIQSNFVF